MPNRHLIVNETIETNFTAATPFIRLSIYIAADMKDLYATMSRINSVFLSGLLLALAHTITHPIKEMTRHATAVAEGRFNRKIPVFGNDEIGQLSQAFNYMTGRLREALSQNEEEKEKLASILANMSDGVVATDFHQLSSHL